VLAKTKSLKCARCETSLDRLLNARDFNQESTREEFSYFKCPSCGCISLHPTPQEMGKYYVNNYRPYQIPETADDLQFALSQIAHRLELITQHKTSGRLLEIGPSFGAFSLGAKNAGFEVSAIEIDPMCANFMNTALQIPTDCTPDTIAAIEGLGIAFDVIAMWHSIEHLPDPWGVLEACASKLAPGGLLVVAAPDPSCLQFRIFQRYWVHLDAPRHLYLIPARTLIGAAADLGLEFISCNTRDLDGRQLNRMGWSVSLNNLLGFRNPRTLFRRICSKLLTMVFYPIEVCANQGACYTIMLRKPDTDR